MVVFSYTQKFYAGVKKNAVNEECFHNQRVFTNQQKKTVD